MDFSTMSGWDFEHYCADCLLKSGFTKANVTSGSSDHGVDIIAEWNDIRFGIQCKLYQGQISNKAIQEVYTGASYYDCDIAVIMSNSELTRQAQKEARKLRVKFWNIVDYIPEKGSDNELKADFNQFVTSYESYCHKRKDQEYQDWLSIEHDLSSRKKVILAIANPYEEKSEHFKKSKAWLKKDNILKSIECFCNELSDTNTLNEQFLLQKLEYIKSLYYAIVKELYRMRYIAGDLCAEIDHQLQLAAEDSMTISQWEFNEKYWSVCYEFECFRNIVFELHKVFEGFTPIELRQIDDNHGNDCHSKDSTDGESFSRLRIYFGKLVKEWKKLSDAERKIHGYWLFWKNDDTMAKEIHQHIKLIADTEDYLIDSKNLEPHRYLNDDRQKYLFKLRKERQTFAILLRKLWIQKREASLFEIKKEQQEKEEQLERKRQEAEQRIQEAEQRIHEYINLKQREQNEQLQEMYKAEKAARIQHLVSHYNTEYQRINSKAIIKRKHLESQTQSEILQAQNQISEFIKQKDTFTLFRKSRDSALDSKVATLNRHIEQISQSFADEVVKCERFAKEEQDNLYKQILNEAEQYHIKEDVLLIISK